jgi:hypothetical protein
MLQSRLKNACLSHQKEMILSYLKTTMLYQQAIIDGNQSNTANQHEAMMKSDRSISPRSIQSEKAVVIGEMKPRGKVALEIRGTIDPRAILNHRKHKLKKRKDVEVVAAKKATNSQRHYRVKTLDLHP